MINLPASLLDDRTFVAEKESRVILVVNQYAGAPHWYGRLETGEFLIDLDHPLTAREMHYRPWQWEGYVVGDATIRFETFDDMLAAAKLTKETHFRGAWLFIWQDGTEITFKEAESDHR